ncbi:MAG: phytoene/squalene synthase family protein [Candidatus Eremiobacteraeota bacterium]|nr:phytoene/squalene synthase family protein [Candidatus Eremiobacteraeota bacterium]
MTTADKRRSQGWCADVMRRKSKSFYFSTRILPRAKREAVEALYGVCRFADDAADEPNVPLELRLRILADVEHDVSMLRTAGYVSDAPWFPALHGALERFSIAIDDLLLLVRGCRGDVDGVQIRCMEDLETYSAAVAGTVGRCAMPVLGAHDEDSLRRAERLGIAMQFTNVLRDVEDDRRMGRNYMPVDEWSGAELCEVMRNLAGRARVYYRESTVLAGRIPNDGSRASLMMTSAVYEGILDKLQAGGFDPNKGRAHVGTVGKLTRAARSVIAAYAGLPTIR